MVAIGYDTVHVGKSMECQPLNKHKNIYNYHIYNNDSNNTTNNNDNKSVIVDDEDP